MRLISKDNRTVIVGLGLTGISCARYLKKKGLPFSLVDSRKEPPYLSTVESEFPDIPVHLGDICAEALQGASRVVVSPGVPLDHPAIKQVMSGGVSVLGDIDLFRAEASAPIVAITGSNGKSTVTTLLGEMLKEAGKDVAIGGNIGIAALDLLQGESPDYYVLELSSFQLERTSNLCVEVATVLNVSADHMDRYDNLSAYKNAKHKIFQGCKKIVFNRADSSSIPANSTSTEVGSFGLDNPGLNEFGLVQHEIDGVDVEFLAFQQDLLMPTSELKLAGRHNLENALAAMSLAHAVGLDFAPMLTVLKLFPGLDHRCKFVAKFEGVDYYNDSKGTNVGAAIASIKGLTRRLGKIVLIAGGESKGADFSPLLPVLKSCVRAVIAVGEAAVQIEELCAECVSVERASSMEEAVVSASRRAKENDVVLLSPACASFDMFENYQQRGEVFCDSVLRLFDGGACS